LKPKLLIYICLALLISFSPFQSISGFQVFRNTTETCSICKYSTNIEYTYVRVLVDGVWWIWVYDEDGNKIMEYIDDDD